MTSANGLGRRPIRVGGASGGFIDHVAAISRLARHPDVDGIVGDWLSENIMTGYGPGKATFLQCFEPAIPFLVRNKTKLAVDAGASDTELLAEVVHDMVQMVGYSMNVAWVEGDDVTDAFKKMVADGHDFKAPRMGKR
ncbi:hypothetical protein B0T10DRAFT_555454 [Thelonectria olida]|uniref:Acyclic terpene utilisation N-terminal domain-containing protein n=1 Tax=Thelonectria olida TaxID=1576542 RepID=A0A9P9AXU3_9HYPO|nr:hypothetical protein B0T10DRAFT_555454 [Thelonectria olida]